ncbi:UNVERIFIED_ORG: hypothetical protein ABIC62_005849 [Burkholderia sp. 1595]|uniref:Uncharacterized protein n=1 Tax=Paraburkholderia terricola TaxID=169427 RepID=A0ABU1M0G9_9BURK|nr:hypothetical protein [Paraburkholderia terricola]MDR6485478.1 hypothetical protein [Paraburkholderia terricola]
MNVGMALETNMEVPEVMQPGMRSLNNTSIFAKAAAMFGTVLGDRRLDPAIAQCSPMPLRAQQFERIFYKPRSAVRNAKLNVDF